MAQRTERVLERTFHQLVERGFPEEETQIALRAVGHLARRAARDEARDLAQHVAAQQARNLSGALEAAKKTVKIEIASKDLERLKQNKYKLCFAKKVGDEAFNVVWQSYEDYLENNFFSWTPQYELFGSNTFQSGVDVRVSTNRVRIGLGQESVLNSAGHLELPHDGGPDISITMVNDYKAIHPGLNQLSTGIDGKTVSTPFYVAQKQIVKGSAALTPVEKVLVWFEQNIETSTMFSTARSNSVEIDLTFSNGQTRLYKDEKWTTP